ncbi:hypothetical protein PEL8287_03870 [Roseovarius litorisediminis]|uniref:DUF3307 domain-containing protein n=1 Tax=Roseovarius litorisediminis TaxID=1312363 RepID=A0A1Y5TQC3_9RHOB|nr:DUF3307 domain-containing protein [Roseovarius litorisediminis]SLN69620.1 hypothetical protein PEL8287_03870 [Roseovarius litorisediminis]
MSYDLLLVTMILFQTKHLVADFVLQSTWMVQTKGIYGHLGGICHSGMHAVLSAAILLIAPISIAMVVLLSVAEFIVHYHVDWIKDRKLKKLGFTAAQKGFWTLAGLDQFAHQITYVGMFLIITRIA